MIKRIRIFINQLLSFDARQRAKHDYENVFLNSQSEIIKLMQRPLTKVSILVLGCGYIYPDVILFSNISKYVAGIDIIDAFYRDDMAQTCRDIRNREGSIVQALLKIVSLLGTYYRYYYYLEKISKIPIEHQKYRLLSYNGYQMPFKNETFDVVLSNAVLEHVEKPQRLFQEVNRVTKKGGLSYHLWHNYYSFSGGHVPEPLCLKYPWGHLRGKYETRGLNRLTPSEIQNSFSKFFDIITLYQVDKTNQKKGIDDDFQFEREELLSESLKSELRAFPIELLLTRAYLIIGRRKDKCGDLSHGV